MGHDLLKSCLDLLKPNLEQKVDVHVHQQIQKAKKERKAMEREFNIGDKVYVCNFRPGYLWLNGEIILVTGRVSYIVELENGHIVRRHIDHIKIRVSDVPLPHVQELEETIPEAVSIKSNGSVNIESLDISNNVLPSNSTNNNCRSGQFVRQLVSVIHQFGSIPHNEE